MRPAEFYKSWEIKQYVITMRAIGMVLTALQVRVEKNKATRANLEDRYMRYHTVQLTEVNK